MKNCKIISITNFKGGTGKTTCSVNLSHGLADRGFKVLGCDLDSQSNYTETMGLEGVVMEEQCISQALRNKHVKAQVNSIKKNLDVIGSNNLSMLGLETELQFLTIGTEKQLQRILKPFEKEYDFIILDLPPAMNAITTNAYVISDRLVVPIQPDNYSLKGLAKLEYRLQEDFDISPTELFISIKERTAISDDVRVLLRETRPSQFMTTFIRKNVALVEANAEGKSVFDYSPASNGAVDYNNFIEELLIRMQ